MDLKSLNVLIIGNGSGGHFFPSLKVANRLKKEKSNIYYLVSKDRVDHKNIENSNYEYLALDYVGLNKNYFSFFKNQIKNIKLIKNYILQNNIKLIIGFGGGLSFSASIAGLLLKIKVVIHEQNAVLGRANKLLINKVSMYSNYDLNNESIKVVGNPIIDGSNISNVDYFDVIIVFGSQGSSSLNVVFDEFLKHYIDKYRILFICGDNSYVYKNKNIIKKEFVFNLNDYFDNTRLVICRGGATTLSELSTHKCKVVVIPSPYVINNHQEKNAYMFKKKYGCQIVNESDLNVDAIKTIITNNLDELKNVNKRILIEKENHLEKFIKELKNEI